jgi:hypothetical protein
MRNDERLIYYYDLVVGVNKQAAVAPSLMDVIEVLKSACDTDDAFLDIDKGTATLSLTHVEIKLDKMVATLLVEISDKRAPDVHFVNAETGNVRDARKQAGEGRGSSAHLLVSLIEQPDRPDTYVALLEKNTGLSRSLVKRLFQAVLRKAYKADPNTFTCENKFGARTRAGNVKREQFRPMLDFEGHPSSDFIDDLEEGTLKEITLIRGEAMTAIGGKTWLKKAETTVTISADYNGLIPNLWNQVKEVLRVKSEDYENARVKFKSIDGHSHTVPIDTASGNIVDDRYVKSVRLTAINPFLDEYYPGIVGHLRDIILNLLLEYRGD